TDYIQLNHAGAADRLVIYNIIGREMRSFNTAPGQRYYIGDLPNGMYLASLVSHKKGVLTTLRVQKSALRP
ncbi:MAG: T9SS type A sorting domain-containing protein, partial [Bacteroidetes bacterium]|nr:T9SS type A sorting domain-containing protein [Bacteroidota bacterium]